MSRATGGQAVRVGVPLSMRASKVTNESVREEAEVCVEGLKRQPLHLLFHGAE